MSGVRPFLPHSRVGEATCACNKHVSMSVFNCRDLWPHSFPPPFGQGWEGGQNVRADLVTFLATLCQSAVHMPQVTNLPDYIAYEGCTFTATGNEVFAVTSKAGMDCVESLRGPPKFSYENPILQVPHVDTLEPQVDTVSVKHFALTASCH